MAVTKYSRLPIAFAAVLVVFLITFWGAREKLVETSLHFLSNGTSASTSSMPTSTTSTSTIPPVSGRPSFYDIASKYGTDKVTDHHYERLYEHRLAPLRDKPIKMLEIGLGCDMSYGPGKSYYTWLEYFPLVDLYYIEYDGACAKEWANKTDKATVYSGDQADVGFLVNFLRETGGQFDVIIDDGGHSMNQQRTSLKILWDQGVKPGGIYFIEDLATSYSPAYGGGPGADVFMKDLQDVLDDMNKAGGVDRFSISKDVINFEFAQEICALTKADQPI